MEKFCEDHIKCQEDTDGTLTCTAHLDSGRAFPCPYMESDIQFSALHDRKVPIKDNGYPCIDYRSVK